MTEGQIRTTWSLAFVLVLAIPAFGQDSSDKAAATTEETPAPKPAPAVLPAAEEKTTTGTVPVSTADVDAGHPVYYDLETGRLEETLPFDVQFYLRIPVSTSVKSMEGRYVGATRPFLCRDAFPKARIYTDYGFGPRELAPSERRQVQPIGFVRFFKDPSKQGALHAELNVVNGLLPNRYYCFEITQVREAVVNRAVFLQAMSFSVDRALRVADPAIRGNEGLSQQSYRDVREAVILAVESQLAPGERIVLPPGSFLDRTNNVLSLPPASKLSFNDVLEAQLKRKAAITTLQNNATDSVVPVLTRLALSDDLKKLREQADRQPRSRKWERVLRERETSLSWADLGCRQAADSPLRLCPEAPPVIAAIAEGTKDAPAAIAELARAEAPSPTTTGLPLDDAWTMEDLKVRRENFDRTLSDLRNLKGLILDLKDENLIAETGVTDDFAGLKSILTDAINELEFLQGDVDLLASRLKSRIDRLNSLLAAIDKEAVSSVLVEGSTTTSFETRANWYLGMDLGFAWSDEIEDFFPYVGTNIYFRPVNKKAHLRWADFRQGQMKSELAKRLSLTLGITLRSLEKDKQFQGIRLEDDLGLIADRPLVVSAGLRLSDFFRLSVGALVFKDRDPDPLIDESKLAWSPLVSLSIDWNVRGALRNRFVR